MPSRPPSPKAWNPKRWAFKLQVAEFRPTCCSAMMKQGLLPTTTCHLSRSTKAMNKRVPPKPKKFPAAKQRRLDELLEKNSEGTISPAEKTRLEKLVAEAEQLMVTNAKRLAEFSKSEAVDAPAGAVPGLTQTVTEHAES